MEFEKNQIQNHLRSNDIIISFAVMLKELLFDSSLILFERNRIYFKILSFFLLLQLTINEIFMKQVRKGIKSNSVLDIPVILDITGTDISDPNGAHIVNFTITVH